MPHQKLKQFTCLIFVLLFLSIPLVSQAKINIMTFNIRYATNKDGINSWEHRKEKVVKTIKNNEAEIIGMQEALNSQVKYLEQELISYDYIGVGRDDGNNLGEYSPIFYKTNKFKLLNYSYFWLSETPNQPSKGWNASCNRVVTWAKFKNKKSKKIFYVFNTHFDKQAKAKRKSAKLLIKKINKIAKNKPVVITGDFNAKPRFKVYNLLTEELIDSQFEVKHHGPKKTYNGFKSTPKKRIDYIFTKNKVKIKHHKTIKSKASDHYPVLMKFSL